jgi:hypothetical protein
MAIIVFVAFENGICPGYTHKSHNLSYGTYRRYFICRVAVKAERCVAQTKLKAPSVAQPREALQSSKFDFHEILTYLTMVCVEEGRVLPDIFSTSSAVYDQLSRNATRKAFVRGRTKYESTERISVPSITSTGMPASRSTSTSTALLSFRLTL